MAEITQKLGFDAQKAITELALTQANAALSKFQGSAKGAAALSKVDKQLDKTAKRAANVTVSWQTMLRVIQTQIIVRTLNAFTQQLGEAVTRARELGIAIEEVRTIDAEGRGAAELSREILALSDAIGKAPTDLAEGLYQTLSNQVVAAGEALNFTSEAARLATITASETGDAVNALSSVMNSYEFSAAEAARVSDTLFTTVEQGRLRLSEIANVIGRVTPLTAELGIAWEETAASIATMTRTGVRADTAITQLRAVVTRLIKPTDDVREIFHRWGVQDGKQAIAAFGGLTGVLQKLEQEVGEGGEGMAELLRNVRAITGAFGILNKEGKTVEEIFDRINTSTGRAADAWEVFSQSDAQQLQIQLTRLENSITQIGENLLPVGAAVVGFLDTTIFLASRGAGVLTGAYTDATRSAETYSQALKEVAEENLKQQAAWAEATRDTYKDFRLEAQGYYAELNKREQAFANVRDNSIKEATAALKDAGDSISSAYQSHIKNLDNLSKQISGRITNNLRTIAGIQADLQDRALANELEGARSSFERRRILEEALSDARQKAASATSEVSADPESLERANTLQERALQIAEKLANESKVGSRAREEAESAIREIQEGRIQTLRSYNQIAAEGEAKTLAHRREVEQIEARINELIKQRNKLFEDGVITQREATQGAAIDTEIGRLTTRAAEGARGLEAFGLEDNFDTVVVGLTEALNSASKDWSVEVARAKQAFENQLLELEFVLDPSGALKELGEQLGTARKEGEFLSDFYRRVVAQAADLGDKQNEIIGRSRAIADEIETATGAIATTFSGAAEGLDEAEAKFRRLAELQRGTISDQAKEQGKAFEQALFQAREIQALIESGAGVSQEMVNRFRATLETIDSDLFPVSIIAGDQIGVLENLGVQFQDVIDKTERLKEVNDELAPTGFTEAFRGAQEAQQLLVQGNRDLAETSEFIENRISVIPGLMDNASVSAQGLSERLTTSGDKAAQAATSTGLIGNAAQSSTSGVDNLANSLSSAADQAERLAAAVRSVGGGGGPQTVANPFQFHGGRMFLADGGFARGQDRIPASLANGEMVVNSRSSRQFFSELNAMNQGSQPVFREQGGPVTNVGDVNVTVQGGDSSQQTVREIGHALRREIQRGNIKLR
jgi:TP901 family phage tail tape measure protein